MSICWRITIGEEAGKARMNTNRYACLTLGAGLSLLVFFSLFCIGCENSLTTRPLFWYTYPENQTFMTNDIEKAQKETSFELVFPRYLPSDLSFQPYKIEGPLANADYQNSAREVFIYYLGPQGKVAIFEQTLPAGILRPSDENHEYLNKSGISILEQKITWTDPVYYVYDWTQGDVHCYVEIWGYSQYVNRKIIYSMID